MWSNIKTAYNDLVLPIAQDIGKFLMDTFFPISCILCGTEGLFICLECRQELQPIPYQKCIACKKPAPLGVTHARCLSPFMANGLISFFDYRDKKVSKIIIHGKYKFLPGVFLELAHITATKMKVQGLPAFENSILVPIPLSSARRRWRGFNQSQIICNSLSKNLNLPVLNALERHKNTKTQKNLKREERITNLSNAFSLSPQIRNSQYEINNCNFIIVDDVTTTGSTLLEAVKVLKRNGANKVWCLTIASD